MVRNASLAGFMGQPVVQIRGNPWTIAGSGEGTSLRITQTGVAAELGYVSAGGSEAGNVVLLVNGSGEWYGRFPADGMCGQNFDGEIRGGISEDIELLIVTSTSGTILGNLGGFDGRNVDDRINNFV